MLSYAPLCLQEVHRAFTSTTLQTTTKSPFLLRLNTHCGPSRSHAGPTDMPYTTEKLYLWRDSAGFSTESDHVPHIHRALHDYSADGSPSIAASRRKITRAVVKHFATQNAFVERWPETIRRSLNRDPKTPFQSHAGPERLAYRVQATAVWHNLLLLLSFHWNKYGSDFYFERMGLHLSDDLKELVDDIAFYSSLVPERRGFNALLEKTLEFMLTCILDPKPSVSTNPLLWWVAVAALTEPCCFPNLPIPNIDNPKAPDLPDLLDVHAKLDALDHYARVLLLHRAFSTWLDGPPLSIGQQLAPPQSFVADLTARNDLAHCFDRVSLQWLNEGHERPPQLYREMTSHEQWASCEAHVKESLKEWFDPTAISVVDQVASLLNGTIEVAPAWHAPEELPTPPFEGGSHYVVMTHLTEDFTTDPMSNDCYPAVRGHRRTLDAAKKLARETITNELGSRDHATAWDERESKDGRMFRVRAIYVGDGENAKAIAWIEVRAGPGPDSDDEGGGWHSEPEEEEDDYF